LQSYKILKHFNNCVVIKCVSRRLSWSTNSRHISPLSWGNYRAVRTAMV